MVRGAFLGLLLVALAASSVRGAQADDADVAGLASQDLRAGGDGKMRYFVVGLDARRNAPAEGYALLLVLPGGDGSAEFEPFIKRIYANALPEGFLVAQLVAVPSEDPKQIVWPTERNRDRKQTFSTEKFIDAVIADVKTRAKVDDRRVYALGWSSGGPAVYAATLRAGSPIRGAFVAMSVFVPADLPPLSGAKGRRFYLLQSPQDRVTRYSFATRAKAQLGEAGAVVRLQDYEGGHGWRGDVFGLIRDGIRWLARVE